MRKLILLSMTSAFLLSGSLPAISGDFFVISVEKCPKNLVKCSSTCVDTENNPSYCGGCGNDCGSYAHTKSYCGNGSCEYVCEFGWLNCNADFSDGCETQVSESHCGHCDNQCDGNEVCIQYNPGDEYMCHDT